MSYNLRKGRSARTIRSFRAINPDPYPVQPDLRVQDYFIDLGKKEALDHATTSVYSATLPQTILAGNTLELTNSDITLALSQAGHSDFQSWQLISFYHTKSSTGVAFQPFSYTLKYGDLTKTVYSISDAALPSSIPDSAVIPFIAPYSPNPNQPYTYLPQLRYNGTEGFTAYSLMSGMKVPNNFDWLNSGSSDSDMLSIENESSYPLDFFFVFHLAKVLP